MELCIMKYMVIENYINGNYQKIYQRFFEKGRMAPDGLIYIESWVDEEMKKCYQIMECEDINLLHEWTSNWQDIVDFEIVPVITSKEAQEKYLNEISLIN